MRVLWISDQLPNLELTAGQVMSDIFFTLKDQVDLSLYLICEEEIYYSVPYSVSEKTVKIFRLPTESHPKHHWLKNPYHFLLRVSWYLLLRKLTRLIGDFDLVLITLQNQFSYELAFHLTKRKFPITTLVWDPPIWRIESKYFPQYYKRRSKLQEKEIYARGFHLFPTPDFALSRGLSSDSFGLINPVLNSSTRKSELNDELITLVFAGSSYAERELTWFISKLNEMDWKIGKYEIFLVYFGDRFKVFEEHPRIQYRGFTDRENLIFQVSGYQIGILPYPVEPKIGEVPLYSMPSKLGIYCAARLPSIFIGPKFGFAQEISRNVGIALEPYTDSLTVANAILYLIDNYSDKQQNTDLILRQFFSQFALNQSLEQLISYYEGSILSVEVENLMEQKAILNSLPSYETVWLISLLRKIIKIYSKLKRDLSIKSLKFRFFRFVYGWPYKLGVLFFYWFTKLHIKFRELRSSLIKMLP